MLYNYTRGRFLENRRESDKVRKKMVKGFNVAQVVGMPVQLSLGPQSCGFGLALKF